MRAVAVAALIVGCLTLSMATASPQTASNQRVFLERYCLTCHTESSRDKGLVPVALDRLDLGRISENAEVWEKVARRVTAGVMPPPNAPRPEARVSREFTSWLTAELDRAAQSHPNPGRPLLHLLNRTAHANAIRDLLDLEIDAATLLPPHAYA